ncbi:MAG TPA: NUDIX domain-containing protein [Candidatus Saccharimonadales bacterium]|nr:NUDIX domain-containing protein [Candidatus Saccharimonadales bacterium]
MIEPIFSPILTRYLELFPDEAPKLNIVSGQIAAKGEASLWDRHEFDSGHATAAGFIVSDDGAEILLVAHPIFKRLLQPGGHMEPGDADPLQAAYREIAEEVGLRKDVLRYRPLDAALPLVPIDIDVHAVAANAKRQEQDHYHYDSRYLFTVPRDTALSLLAAELDGLQWLSFAEFAAIPDFVRPAAKIKTLLAAQTS